MSIDPKSYLGLLNSLISLIKSTCGSTIIANLQNSMMANICGFNKIAKLQQLTVIATGLHSRSIRHLSQKYSGSMYIKSRQAKSLLQLGNFLNKTRNFSTNLDTGGGYARASSLDEFRTREEQREAEFEKMQEPQPDEDRMIKAESIRKEILESSLPFVSTHGWTKKAIAAGAEIAGYPGVAHGMFPDGGVELVQYFYNKCNQELVARLKCETNNGELPIRDPLEFLIAAVKSRLQMIEPYISHWPQALAMMSLPRNAPTSLAQLLTLVDDICYYSGDRSVDFGWYTRRIGLASIFKVTELYMLQDASMEHQATWAFLRKRMGEATQLENFLSQSEGLTHNVQKTLNSAFVTARNILGLGYNRR